MARAGAQSNHLSCSAYDPLNSDSDMSADEFLAEYRKRKQIHKNHDRNVEISKAQPEKNENRQETQPKTQKSANENIKSRNIHNKKPKKPKRHSKKKHQVPDVFIRLSKPAQVPKIPDEPKSTGKCANWKRLYAMSVAKPPVIEPPQVEDLSGTAKSNAISRQIAKQRTEADIAVACETITGRVLTGSELSEKLVAIGILGPGQSLLSTYDINPLFTDCVIEKHVNGDEEELLYSGDRVAEVIRQAVLGDHPTKLGNVVRAAIRSSAAPKDAEATPVPDVPEHKCMSLDARDRLSSPKHRSKKRKWMRKCDPMIWGYQKPPSPPSMSARTRKILSHMGKAQLPFEERDRLFILLKGEQLEAMRNEQYTAERNLATRRNRSPIMRDTQMGSKLDICDCIQPEPEGNSTHSHREDKLSQILGPDRHPSGWDSNITRHRLAHIRRKKQRQEEDDKRSGCL